MDSIGLAKLRPPLPERGLSIRPSVLEALGDTTHPVVYLCAGPGSGKTATASLFAARSGPAVWYELDAGDNTLHSFVLHLGLAMRRALPAFEQRIGLYPAMHSTARVALDLLDGFLAEYRRLAHGPDGPQSICIVLDNVQRLDDKQIGLFLGGLVRKIPEGLRLVLLGTSRLLETEALAGSESLVRRIGDEDMLLDRKEAEKVVGYDAEPVWQSSGGWPCTINAFRLLLQQHRDIDVPAERLRMDGSCDRTHMACFEGILETLPGSLRRFVEDIRLLEDMTPALCNKMAGIGNAAALLEYLVNNHYYLKKKDGGHYRFYAPFATYLRSVLPPTKEEYQKAATCMAETGNWLDAGRFAFLADDRVLLEQCAGQVGDAMIAAGLMPELDRWLERLGGERCGPVVCLLQAKLLLLHGQSNDALPAVDRALSGFRAAGEGDRLVEAMRYRAMLTRRDGVCEDSCSILDEMLPEAAAVSPEAECLLLADKVCCLFLSEQSSVAASQIETRLAAARAAGNERMIRWYEWIMIAVHYHKGRFPETVASRKAAEGITREELDLLGKAANQYYAVRALQNMDELEEARKLFDGWQVTPAEPYAIQDDLWNELVMSIECLTADLYRDHILEQPLRDEKLDPLLDRIREFVTLFPDSHRFAATARVEEQVAALLRGGDAVEIAREIRALQEDCIPPVYLSAMSKVVPALLDGDHVSEASTIVEECFERNEKDNLPYAAAMYYGLMACIALRNRQETVAVEYVRASVSLAAHSRMIALYADRVLFEPVINIAVDENIEPEFIRTVIDRFDYRIKKVYVNCFGPFYAAPIKTQDRHIHFRTNKTRELLALLLHNRNRALTKSELSTALFGDDSIRNNKLLDVTIYYLRAAFRERDLDSPVQYQNGGYSASDHQIDSGIPAASNAILAFRRFPGRQTAEAVLQAIPDVYMKDIDSPWASIQRDLYEELALLARQTLENTAERV
ncbi:MAG: hypothetical protein GX153_11720 [Clostridiaceae bacterium]|nr:hypothetical protein [Clostridiaceae bacterium]